MQFPEVGWEVCTIVSTIVPSIGAITSVHVLYIIARGCPLVGGSIIGGSIDCSTHTIAITQTMIMHASMALSIALHKQSSHLPRKRRFT